MTKLNKIMCVIAATAVLVAFSGDMYAAKKEKKETTASAVNDKCPMSGKAINEKCTSAISYSVCCKGCAKKAGKAPTKALAKISELPNETCPMKGKDISDKSPKVTFAVAFCCGKCKTGFDKDPAKHLAKIKAAKKEDKG